MRIYSGYTSAITQSYSTYTSTSKTSTSVESASTQQELVAVYEKGSDSTSDTAASFLYSPPRTTLASVSSTGFVPTSTVPSEVHQEWQTYLTQASNDYLDQIFMRIDQDRDGISSLEISQLQDEHQRWIQDMIYQVRGAFSSFLIEPGSPTYQEAQGLLDQNISWLDDQGNLKDILWQGISDFIGEHREAAAAARGFYTDFEQAYTADSLDFMKEIESRIVNEQGFITDERLNQYLNDLDNWLSNNPADFLWQALNGSPTGIKVTLMETFQSKIQSLSKQYGDMIRQQVNARNYPPKKPNPEDLFHYGRHSFEINVGTHKGQLKIQDATSQSDKSTFYVVDAKGVKKKVSLKFDNADLQAEFDKLFKKSTFGKGDKTISLEKLNKLLGKVKDGLKTISDTDLERLASELHSKEESEKLNKHVNEFLAIMKRALVG